MSSYYLKSVATRPSLCVHYGHSLLAHRSMHAQYAHTGHIRAATGLGISEADRQRTILASDTPVCILVAREGAGRIGELASSERRLDMVRLSHAAVNVDARRQDVLLKLVDDLTREVTSAAVGRYVSVRRFPFCPPQHVHLSLSLHSQFLLPSHAHDLHPFGDPLFHSSSRSECLASPLRCRAQLCPTLTGHY